MRLAIVDWKTSPGNRHLGQSHHRHRARMEASKLHVALAHYSNKVLIDTTMGQCRGSSPVCLMFLHQSISRVWLAGSCNGFFSPIEMCTIITAPSRFSREGSHVDWRNFRYDLMGGLPSWARERLTSSCSLSERRRANCCGRLHITKVRLSLLPAASVVAVIELRDVSLARRWRNNRCNRYK